MSSFRMIFTLNRIYLVKYLIQSFRHKTDRERQKQLAKLRTEFRQKKLALGYTFERELDEYARPEKGVLG